MASGNNKKGNLSDMFLFYTCDAHNSTSSAVPKFLFRESVADAKLVIEHIKNNIGDYFDGDIEEVEPMFEELRKSIKDNGISVAINSDTSVYAMCEEIKPINKL